MSSKKIIGSISSIVCRLIELGLASDQNYSRRKVMSNGDITVSVSKAPGASFLRCESYADLYNEVERRHAFDLKLLDGALVSLSYTFQSDETLKHHRLAFLPSPELSQFQNFPDCYIGDVPFVDIVGAQVHPSPLRFDFDIGNAQSVRHPASHLTIGQYTNCRIPVSAPLEPVEFIAFIVRHFYDASITQRDQLLSSKLFGLFDDTLTPEESRIPHFKLHS